MIKNVLALISLIVLPLCSRAQFQIDFDEQAIEQDFINNFKIYSSAYTDPVLDVYGFNQMIGWSPTAKVLDTWEFRIQVLGAVSFVPDQSLEFNFNEQGFTNNLQLKTNAANPNLPTVLGGETDQVFIYTVEDENGMEYEQEIPVFGGINSPFNAVPDVVPQISVGLPAGFEFSFRLFPKVEIEGVKHDQWGLGLKHQLNQYLWDDNDFHWNLEAGYSQNTFSGEPDEFLDGQNQQIRLRGKVLTLGTNGSYDYKFLHLFAGVQYYNYTTNFDVLGTYKFEVEAQGGPVGVFNVQEAFSTTDPLSIDNKGNGVRVNAGITVDILKYVGLSVSYAAGQRQSLLAGLNINIVR